MAALLFRCGASLRGELPPSPLSLALHFVYHDYAKDYYYWELFEMGRRFLLVGVAVVAWRGTLVQLTFATLTSLVYLVIQHQAAPYAHVTDNFIALATSLALSTLYFACILLKLGILIDLEELRALLSVKLRDVFDVPIAATSVIIFASVLLSLAFAAFTIVQQLRHEQRRSKLASLAQKARRLRYDKTDAEVVPPPVDAGEYHLFLSQ